MSICVFVGPTLELAEARRVLPAEYLPPAAVGDVYRAARRRPHAIAIIDGFFERTPAIWHKEILWAMAEGVHVFGSSSMGALRAAELADFGMVGIGRVFAGYHSGALEDEDEVAVAHASAGHEYRPLSDAMVNVRATLLAAQEQWIVSGEALRELEGLAKSLFYPERKLELIVRSGVARGLITAAEGERLSAWLPHGRVDQKREDALDLLRHLSEVVDTLHDKKRVNYDFEHTHTWEELLREVGAGDEAGEADELDEIDRAILDELKLRGRFLMARRGGMSRLLALEEVTRIGRRVSASELKSTAEQLRRERGLFKPQDFRAWLTENRLDVRNMEDFLRDEASVSWLDQGLAQVSEIYILDHLRVCGEYHELVAYVARRDAVLRERGHDPADPELPPGYTMADLWSWYFEECLRRSVPENLSAYAISLGFPDKASLQTAVLREFIGCMTN